MSPQTLDGTGSGVAGRSAPQPVGTVAARWYLRLFTAVLRAPLLSRCPELLTHTDCETAKVIGLVESGLSS